MNWQERADEFARKHNLHYSSGVYALDLISEMGEVAEVKTELKGLEIGNGKS